MFFYCVNVTSARLVIRKRFFPGTAIPGPYVGEPFSDVPGDVARNIRPGRGGLIPRRVIKPLSNEVKIFSEAHSTRPTVVPNGINNISKNAMNGRTSYGSKRFIYPSTTQWTKCHSGITTIVIVVRLKGLRSPVTVVRSFVIIGRELMNGTNLFRPLTARRERSEWRP